MGCVLECAAIINIPLSAHCMPCSCHMSSVQSRSLTMSSHTPCECYVCGPLSACISCAFSVYLCSSIVYCIMYSSVPSHCAQYSRLLMPPPLLYLCGQAECIHLYASLVHSLCTSAAAPLSDLEGVRRAATGECDVVVCLFVDCQSHVAPYTHMQL